MKRAVRPKRSISHADGTEVRTYVGKAPFDDSPPDRPLGRVCELDDPWDGCQCNGCQRARAWAGRTPPPKPEKLPSTGNMRSVVPGWPRYDGLDPELADDAPTHPLGAPTFEELPDVEQQLTRPERPERLDETAEEIENGAWNYGRRTIELVAAEPDDVDYDLTDAGLVPVVIDYGSSVRLPSSPLNLEEARSRQYLRENTIAWNEPTGFPPGPQPLTPTPYEDVYEITLIDPELLARVVTGQAARGRERTIDEQELYDWIAVRLTEARASGLASKDLEAAYGISRSTLARLRKRAYELRGV